MKKRIVFILPIFLLILLSNIAYADWIPNYPYDYCELKLKTDTRVALWCTEDVLFSQYGLYVSVPSDAGITYVEIHRSFDPTQMKFIIIVVLVADYENKIVVNLPPMKDYAGVSVNAWNLTFYYDINNSIASSNIILTANSWSVKGWEIPVDFPITQVILTPAGNVVNPAPSLPSWNDFLGWFNFLLYLLNEVAKAMPTALSIFANAVVYLLQIAPLLLLIIPLHIIFSFVEDPQRGVSTINFYISLARKIIDLLVQIIHAIIDFIGHIIPF